MPYLHLPFHDAAEPTEAYSTCCPHTSAPETGPEEAEPQHGGHDDCSLCELMLVPVDLPPVLCRVDTVPVLTREASLVSTPEVASIPASHQARAPPFMTV